MTKQDEPGFTLHTHKEPLHLALQEKQAQVDYWGDRCCKAEARVAELEGAARTALRQWRMYADMVERNEGFDLATEKSAEGDMYRQCFAVLAHGSAGR